MQQVTVLAQVGQDAAVLAREFGASHDAEASQGVARLCGIVDGGDGGQGQQLGHGGGEFLVTPIQTRCAGRSTPMGRVPAPGQELQLARAVNNEELQALASPAEELGGDSGIELALVDDQRLVAGAVRLDESVSERHVIAEQQ